MFLLDLYLQNCMGENMTIWWPGFSHWRSIEIPVNTVTKLPHSPPCYWYLAGASRYHTTWTRFLVLFPTGIIWNWREGMYLMENLQKMLHINFFKLQFYMLQLRPSSIDSLNGGLFTKGFSTFGQVKIEMALDCLLQPIFLLFFYLSFCWCISWSAIHKSTERDLM